MPFRREAVGHLRRIEYHGDEATTARMSTHAAYPGQRRWLGLRTSERRQRESLGRARRGARDGGGQLGF